MNKHILPIGIGLVVVFITVLGIHKKSDSTDNSNIVNTDQLYRMNFNKYKERFERSKYHLSKALQTVNEVQQSMNALDKTPLSEDDLIQLNILHHRSSVHLSALIELINEFEEYPNLSEKEALDHAIDKLASLDQQLMNDSLNSQNILDAFNFTLNTLAKAELEISEAAIKTNQKELAVLSIKQAQLHVKTALLLDYSMKSNDFNSDSDEYRILTEIEQLIQSDTITIHELDKQIASISKEIDVMIKKNSQ